jgi:hypothetical protein
MSVVSWPENIAELRKKKSLKIITDQFTEGQQHRLCNKWAQASALEPFANILSRLAECFDSTRLATVQI